jgi:hypothetical protein
VMKTLTQSDFPQFFRSRKSRWDRWHRRGLLRTRWRRIKISRTD